MIVIFYLYAIHYVLYITFYLYSTYNIHVHHIIHYILYYTLYTPLTLIHIHITTGAGKRRLQLEHMKDELRYPYLDLRVPNVKLTEKDLFSIITGAYLILI